LKEKLQENKQWKLSRHEFLLAQEGDD
jgi:hypothetical protein